MPGRRLTCIHKGLRWFNEPLCATRVCAGENGTWSLPANDHSTQAKFFLNLTGDCVTDLSGFRLPACSPLLRFLLPSPHLHHELQISSPEKQRGWSCHQQEPACPREKSLLLHLPLHRFSGSAKPPFWRAPILLLPKRREDSCSLSCHSLVWGQLSLSTTSCTDCF